MPYPIRTRQQLRLVLVGFRKEAGLTQAALASLLGVTQQSYAKIEANPSTTSVERLFTILRLLGAEIVLDRDKNPASPLREQVAPKLRKPSAPHRTTAVAPTPRKILPPPGKKESW